MCDPYVVEWFFVHVVEASNEFTDKRILEIGSRDVNGSVRRVTEKLGCPKEYIGIDIQEGKGVDLVLPVEKIVEHFGPESFDVIICTEVLEHVKDWQIVIGNIKKALKKGGLLYITTRSYGFKYHAYPFDYWRYEQEDMKKIFSDFKILQLSTQKESPGVFIKAKKTQKKVELENFPLYSIALGKRTTKTPELTIKRKFLLTLRKFQIIKQVI